MLQRWRGTEASITRGRALTLLLFALVIAYVLWNVELFDFVMYPVRLFVTYVHEAGHSSMALLTGGDVVGFSVSSDGSGVAFTRGGTRALILPAGYLGAALFGAGLFYLTNTVRRPRTIAMGLGILLIVFTVLFASPDPGGAPLALIVGLAFGAALIAIGWKLDRDINLLVLNVLALLTALNAVLDLVYLTRFSRASETVCGRGTLNDAAAFSCEVASGIPPYIWAGLWALMALALVAAAAYYAILRPLLKPGIREEGKSELATLLDSKRE